MNNSWFKKLMPTIGDVNKFMEEFAPKVSSIKGVKSIFAWGSYAENYKDASKILKEVDIVVLSDFYSEDLISINASGDRSPLGMKVGLLEENGFDPLAVEFTKKFIEPQKININHWAISSDKKFLHFGAILESPEEWAELKIEAEKYADFSTGLTKEAISTADPKLQNKWSVMYDHHINKFLIDMPRGWYQTNHKIKDIMPKMFKLK